MYAVRRCSAAGLASSKHAVACNRVILYRQHFMCHHARRMQQLQRCIIMPHAADGDWDMKNADTLDQLIAGLKDLREKQALGLAPPDEEDEEEDEFEDGEEGVDWVWWRADDSADSTASPAPASAANAAASSTAASSTAASTRAASAPIRRRIVKAPSASSSDSDQLASSIIAAVGARLTQREAQQGSSTPLQRPSSIVEPGSSAASGQQQEQQEPQQQGQQQPARVEEEQPALPRKRVPLTAARSQRAPTPGKRSGTKTAAPADDQDGSSAKQPSAKPGKYSNSKSFLQ